MSTAGQTTEGAGNHLLTHLGRTDRQCACALGQCINGDDSPLILPGGQVDLEVLEARPKHHPHVRATRDSVEVALGRWLVDRPGQERRENGVPFRTEDEERDQDDRRPVEAGVEDRSRVSVTAWAEDYISGLDEVSVRQAIRPHASGHQVRVGEPLRREVLQFDQGNAFPRSSRHEPLMASVARLNRADFLESCAAGAGQDFDFSLGFAGQMGCREHRIA